MAIGGSKPLGHGHQFGVKAVAEIGHRHRRPMECRAGFVETWGGMLRIPWARQADDLCQGSPGFGLAPARGGGEWGAGGLLLLEIVHLLLGALAGVWMRARRCDGCWDRLS